MIVNSVCVRGRFMLGASMCAEVCKYADVASRCEKADVIRFLSDSSFPPFSAAPCLWEYNVRASRPTVLRCAMNMQLYGAYEVILPPYANLLTYISYISDAQYYVRKSVTKRFKSYRQGEGLKS